MVFAHALLTKRFHAEQGPVSQGVPGMQNSVVSLSINFIFLNKHYLKRQLISQFFFSGKDYKKKNLLFTFLCIKLEQNFLSALNK